MVSWFNFENYRKQKCCKEVRDFVGCLAFYQESVTEQNEMCRQYQQDLATCMDKFIPRVVKKNEQVDSQKFEFGNQSQKPGTDWSKPSSSGFHLG